MKKFSLIVATLLFISCTTTKSTFVKTKLLDNNTFELIEISNDASYGFSEKNPIQVGGVYSDEGPINERRFLNALSGPNGETITYHRAGSCCPIKSKNNPFGGNTVMLDNYRITWQGSKDTVSIYINMYDSGILKAPKGFTIKNKL